MKMRPETLAETVRISMSFGIGFTAETIRFAGKGALWGLDRVMSLSFEGLVVKPRRERRLLFMEQAQRQIAQGAGEFAKAVSIEPDPPVDKGGEPPLTKEEKIVGVGLALHAVGLSGAADELRQLGADKHGADIIEGVLANTEPRLLEPPEAD